ncbi:hypothetical protein IT407_03400 [Candidatus Uhrbacteria bacterium]|nr:hypothetical protein [Candidatus Uhrbacteria bacterium]
MNLRKTVLGALTLIAFPIGAIAAPLTNTQLLNKAFLNINERAPSRVEGEFRYDVEIKPVGKSGADEALSMNSKIGFRVRSIPNTDPKLSQNEGRLSIELTGGSFLSVAPIAWNGPITAEWKIVDKMAYIRVVNIPSGIIEYAKKEAGFDPTPLIGVWVGTSLELDDLTQGLSEIRTLPDTKTLEELTGVSTAEWKQLERTPILSVTRVEKTWRNASGEEIRRLRFRINPAFINAVQNLEIRRLPRDSYRTQAIRDINTRYATLRTQLNRFAMVANVNVPKVRVERIEFGGSMVEQQKNDCTWNTRTSKYDCKVSSTMTMRVNGGMSFLVDDGAPVIPPTPFLTPDEFMKLAETGTRPVSSEYGENRVTGLVAESDKILVNRGENVTLTINANHVGNWDYYGNQIHIIEAGTNKLEFMCQNSGTCTAAFPVTSLNSAIQYEVVLYDRNGERVLSSLSPVIYVR